MSIRLDAVAYRNRSEYRIKRLEETIVFLDGVVSKMFYDDELYRSYVRNIQDIRDELYNNRQESSSEEI